MKRITHIIDSLDIGGAERIVVELATGLDWEAFQSEVITLTEPKTPELKQELERHGIRVTTLRKGSKLGLGMFEDLTEHLKRVHPDIVHTHLFAADVWGGLAAANAHIPVVVSTEHSVNKDEGWLKHRLKCYTHSKRDAVVAISHSVKEYIEERCGGAVKGKVHIIPNGVDTNRFSAPVERPPHDIPRIVVVGRLEPVKGHELLIEALPLVTQPYQLQIIGEGTQRALLQAMVEENNLQKQVRFEGFHSDVERFYSEADVAVMPSRWEGLSLSAIEAQVSGCAVLASDVDGLREVVQHNQTGLLVDIEDSAAVAKQLDRLLAEPPLRKRLATAGQQHAVEHYSLDTMLESYTSLYNELT